MFEEENITVSENTLSYRSEDFDIVAHVPELIFTVGASKILLSRIICGISFQAIHKSCCSIFACSLRYICVYCMHLLEIGV